MSDIELYKNLLISTIENPWHFDLFEKNSIQDQIDRLHLMYDGDLIFRKKLRELKNEFLILKKKITVMGYSVKEVLEGQNLKSDEFCLI